MITIFEWLFKYRPFLYERGTIDFQPLWPPLVIWLLFAAAVLATLFLYRRSAGGLSNSWRYGLSALRASAFLVIAFIFLQPVLRMSTVVAQENFVAVAYDLSKSMEIEDGDEGKSRLEIEQNILRSAENPLLDELASKFKLRFFRFSGSTERTKEFEDVERHGDITDLERSLLEISEELATVPLAGIVLVTDGADNHSENLDVVLSQFRARNIPIYSVGIGSESFERDAEIVQVITPKKALKDAVIEAEVSVRSVGYPGQRTTRGPPLIQSGSGPVSPRLFRRQCMRIPRLIIAAIVVLAIVVLIIQNTEAVETRIFFITITLPRAILLGTTLALGWVVGLITSELLTPGSGGK